MRNDGAAKWGSGMTRATIDHRHREDILAAAAIRAMLCASRGLSDSQACHPPGADHFEHGLGMVAESSHWPIAPDADSEGGEL